MVARQLGKLERADIRTVWKSEASNFAPLLASFEGFEMLSAAIELELAPYRAAAASVHELGTSAFFGAMVSGDKFDPAQLRQAVRTAGYQVKENGVIGNP